MKRIGWLALAVMASGCGAPQSNDGAEVNAEEVETAPAGAPSNARAPATPARSSQFTPLTDAACKLKSTEEETGDWVRTCPGVGGYTVEWSSGDLREDLTLVRGGTSTGLGLPVAVANGAFDALGKQVEWRGPAGGAPDMLVVRVHVADQTGKNDSGRLVIVRLEPTPCLAAIVGVKSGQSAQARAIADRAPLPSCLEAAQ